MSLYIVQTRRMYKTKSEPQCRLWASGPEVVTVVPLWRGMSILGETRHVWGQGAYRKSLYVPLIFAVNLKPPYQTLNRQGSLKGGGVWWAETGLAAEEWLRRFGGERGAPSPGALLMVLRL